MPHYIQIRFKNIHKQNISSVWRQKGLSIYLKQQPVRPFCLRADDINLLLGLHQKCAGLMCFFSTFLMHELLSQHLIEFSFYTERHLYQNFYWHKYATFGCKIYLCTWPS